MSTDPMIMIAGLLIVAAASALGIALALGLVWSVRRYQAWRWRQFRGSLSVREDWRGQNGGGRAA